MDATKIETWTSGTPLPPLVLPPVDRSTLALFAGASGDHHPMHIDLDYARKVGKTDVFAHGMLGMAWLGRALTARIPQFQLRHFEARFVDVTHLGDVLTCDVKVGEVREENGVQFLHLSLSATDQRGCVKLTGFAQVTVA